MFSSPRIFSPTPRILIPFDTDRYHLEYHDALRLATLGRILLDIKQSGRFKARGVKQGFKEDLTQADGPDFNYYAHVAKLMSVRATSFRYKRGTRRVALKDVRTAFLQYDKYPADVTKYICFKDPLTLQWKYYRQTAPIYGENSDPTRWEHTIAPWLCSDEVGLQRGENEPCAYVHPSRELLALRYVDD